MQAGESLWGIARKYEVSVDDIIEWNQLDTSAGLSIGQELKVQPGNSKPEPTTPKETYTTYIVRGGDSLYKIARQFGMTVEEIMKLNKLSSTSLSVGDQLKVKQP